MKILPLEEARTYQDFLKTYPDTLSHSFLKDSKVETLNIFLLLSAQTFLREHDSHFPVILETLNLSATYYQGCLSLVRIWNGLG